MKVEDTKFDKVVKRKKKLSKKYYGTSHVLSKGEAKFVFEKGCEHLIVGSGASIAGSRSLFHEKGLQGLVAADPQGDPCLQQVALQKKSGLLHVTCWTADFNALATHPNGTHLQTYLSRM